jgi:hypothetical protein
MRKPISSAAFVAAASCLVLLAMNSVAVAAHVPKPLHHTSPMGQKWSATFGSDGSVRGVSECKAGQTDNCRITDTGTYSWQDDHTYCITWNSWMGGCFENK